MSKQVSMWLPSTRFHRPLGPSSTGNSPIMLQAQMWLIVPVAARPALFLTVNIKRREYSNAREPCDQVQCLLSRSVQGSVCPMCNREREELQATQTQQRGGGESGVRSVGVSTTCSCVSQLPGCWELLAKDTASLFNWNLGMDSSLTWFLGSIQPARKSGTQDRNHKIHP